MAADVATGSQGRADPVQLARATMIATDSLISASRGGAAASGDNLAHSSPHQSQRAQVLRMTPLPSPRWPPPSQQVESKSR